MRNDFVLLSIVIIAPSKKKIATENTNYYFNLGINCIFKSIKVISHNSGKSKFFLQ